MSNRETRIHGWKVFYPYDYYVLVINQIPILMYYIHFTLCFVKKFIICNLSLVESFLNVSRVTITEDLVIGTVLFTVSRRRIPLFTLQFGVLICRYTTNKTKKVVRFRIKGHYKLTGFILVER